MIPKHERNLGTGRTPRKRIGAHNQTVQKLGGHHVTVLEQPSRPFKSLDLQRHSSMFFVRCACRSIIYAEQYKTVFFIFVFSRVHGVFFMLSVAGSSTPLESCTTGTHLLSLRRPNKGPKPQLAGFGSFKRSGSHYLND